MVTSCNSAMKRKLTSTRHITLQQRVLLAVALTTTVREQPSKAMQAETRRLSLAAAGLTTAGIASPQYSKILMVVEARD